jgi:hypothetical protein
MSIIVECEGETVWSPGLSSGSTFRSFVDALSSRLGLDTGLRWTANDMAEVEAAAFIVFVDAALDHYRSAGALGRTITEGVVVVLVALASRCGYQYDGEDAEMVERLPFVLRSMPV